MLPCQRSPLVIHPRFRPRILPPPRLRLSTPCQHSHFPTVLPICSHPHTTPRLCHRYRHRPSTCLLRFLLLHHLAPQKSCPRTTSKNASNSRRSTAKTLFQRSSSSSSSSSEYKDHASTRRDAAEPNE